MTKPKIRPTLPLVGILILLLSAVVSFTPLLAHAQKESAHLDNTGKIAGVFLRPGVRDEFKSDADVAWSHTIDTLRGTQGGDAQRSQIINRYQDYAILASSSDSVGDFQFDFWIVEPVSDIRIYLPSNFTFAYKPSGSGEVTPPDKVFSIWTDITNDYSYISVETLEQDDPIAPGWDRIEIGRMPTPGSPIPSFAIPSIQITPGLYHIRLFEIRAPSTAGLYHFKIYVDGESIGEGNFPITIVKSSLQPAYVTGLVKLLEVTPPVLASGRVTATGVTSDGGYADAVAYFGPGDFERADEHDSYYRYHLFGLPAGTFLFTASASGFQKNTTRTIVAAGQSLGLADIELERAAEVQVKVWSKDDAGPIPWGNLWQLPYGTNDPNLPIDDEGPHRDILIRLLDQYDQSVGYWASDDINAPFGPPWTSATIDGIRTYSPLILKPSTLPSSTFYAVTLNDSRGLPGIRLDGHVPADEADFIEGIDKGPYTIEIQVTGYVMKESDDWQRTFTISHIPGSYALEVDLRRSNWITASVIIPDHVPTPVSSPTAVVVAKGTDGLEKGVAAGTFPAGANRLTLVLEGFNALYNNQRPSTDFQDYGLQPVDYTLELYMADMGSPFNHTLGAGWYMLKDPQMTPEVRTGLGKGYVPAAFFVEASSIEFTIRSTRIQNPTQLSPWTFPGAGVRVFIMDEQGNVVATLDPTFYGLVQDDGTITNDPYDIDQSDVGRHGLVRVLFTGVDLGPVAALSGFYPTRIEEGKYFVSVATLGYIQRHDYTAYVTAGLKSGLQVDLVQGGQVRVDLKFWHAGQPTAFNGFVRVEIYDQVGTLVGASIYAGAEPNPNLEYLPYDASRDWKLVQGAAEGAGTGAQPQRAFFSRLYYGIPPGTWADWPATTPSDANRLSVPSNATAVFDVFGFYSYYGGPDSRRDGLWANGWDTTDGVAHLDSGIGGSRDALDMEGSGNFTVRVWAFDPYGPDGIFNSSGPDGLFGTDDDYTSPDALDGSVSDFRAFTQTADATDVQVPWGGSTIVHINLDEVPSLLGLVYWVDMYSDLRTLPWAQVIERSPGSSWTSSATGAYRIWLPEGSHEFLVTTIGEEQLWEPFSFEITLAGSGSHSFRDVTLTTSATPIPELTNVTWTAVTSVTALLIVIQRQRKRRVSTSSRR